jgi:hypothetical protein
VAAQVSAPLKGHRLLAQILAALVAAVALDLVGIVLAPKLAELAIGGRGTLILKDPRDPERFAFVLGLVCSVPAFAALLAVVGFRLRRGEAPSMLRAAVALVVPLTAVGVGFVLQTLWVRAALASEPSDAPRPLFTLENLDIADKGLQYGVAIGLATVLWSSRKPK